MKSFKVIGAESTFQKFVTGSRTISGAVGLVIKQGATAPFGLLAFTMNTLYKTFKVCTFGATVQRDVLIDNETGEPVGNVWDNYWMLPNKGRVEFGPKTTVVVYITTILIGYGILS